MELFLIPINPIDVFLWTFRKNEKDVVNLYNTLSPVMQIATGGSMLNFGYWSKEHSDPISAQENLCNVLEIYLNYLLQKMYLTLVVDYLHPQNYGEILILL
uniref:Methyltransferase type 11 n=1 Tax=uncultured marine thaumarchaeote AD1000_06_F06 TaxID=1455885 RepID=A0A075FHA2_9ARCH|nr:methyltransferase type 11 [uncultured marine thaumarchaeote AD1000_06_F06]